MELLVYARNTRAWLDRPDQPPRRDLGAVVGEHAPMLCRGERLCSFVEVRLPFDVFDPSTEIDLLVAKAFAAWGHPGGRRVLRFANTRGRVAMMLEPGFERARDICQVLRPVLPLARALLDRASGSSGWSEGAGSAVPESVVSPRSERVSRLELHRAALPVGSGVRPLS